MNLLKVLFDIIKSISIKGIGFVISEGNIIVTYKEISKNSLIKNLVLYKAYRPI